MPILNQKRCNIGESPIWNDKEQKLYFTNAFDGKEICTFDFRTENLDARGLPFDVAALAFDKENHLIVSHAGGVHILHKDASLAPVYDNERYQIHYANDMKVGPDGAIYVGTQSEKRKGISQKIDGKLYRISPNGKVTVLLDRLLLSNGMDWSTDEAKFYHTDSDTQIIKEYFFDKKTGEIEFSGRQIRVPGIDGFTIDQYDCLYGACWGQGHIAVVHTSSMKIVDNFPTPCKVPASCAFCGKDMEILAVTSASAFADLEQDPDAGFTVLIKRHARGRKPFLFGERRICGCR